MTNETQPFDSELYDAILKEAGYQHDYECNAPATMFSLGIEAAADIAARLAAVRQPAPVVGDEASDEELVSIYLDNWMAERMTDHEGMAPELAGIRAVREALAARAVQVPDYEDADDGTPCEVCGCPCSYGSRHGPCGQYAMRRDKELAAAIERTKGGQE